MSPPPPTGSILKSSIPGSTLEARLAALEKILQVTEDGSIVIKGLTSVTIEAGTQIKLKAGVSVDVQSNSQVSIKASSQLDLKASGATIISGAIVKLNGGGLPVARVSDMVTNGRISAGNPTVLA